MNEANLPAEDGGLAAGDHGRDDADVRHSATGAHARSSPSIDGGCGHEEMIRKPEGYQIRKVELNR